MNHGDSREVPQDLPPRTGTPSYVVCLWTQGLAEYLLSRARVHFVLFDVEHVRPDPALLARAESVHVVSDFNALEELATIAADLQIRDPDIEMVISVAELSQLGAATLAAMLGLPENPVGQVAARDKRLMKELVGALDVPTAAFWSLPDPSEAPAVRELADRITYPAVVKPAAGSGTEYTAKVADADELCAFAERFGQVTGLASHQLIVEEFVDGEEMHVDAIWDGEEARFLLASAYFQPPLASIGGDVTYGSRVINAHDAPDLYDEILAMNRTVNRALGFVDRRFLTHMEVFREPSGRLVFSEIATRIGGGWAPMILSQAFGGHDIWPIVGGALLDGKVPEPSPTAPHLAGVHIQARRPGIITSVPGPEEFAATPGVLSHEIRCEVGDHLEMDSASEWCAWIVVGAPDPEELASRISGATRRLRVETRPVP